MFFHLWRQFQTYQGFTQREERKKRLSRISRPTKTRQVFENSDDERRPYRLEKPEPRTWLNGELIQVNAYPS
jgi:hypothetical protein